MSVILEYLYVLILDIKPEHFKIFPEIILFNTKLYRVDIALINNSGKIIDHIFVNKQSCIKIN